MTNNTIDLLHKKYGTKTKIYSPILGKCKEVYIIENKKQKFIVLIDRKNTYEHQYRFLRSNYMQKFLYDQNLPVANVLDIFYFDKKRIAAKHTYLEGKNIEDIDKETAYKLGEVIAKFHLCSIKNFHPVYPFKYKIFDIIRKIKNFFRIKKLTFRNKNIKNLPLGICQRDLNLNNFIITKDKIFLIDFDRWRYWPLACELVRFIQHKTLKQEIINGYQSVRPLTTEEKQYLIQKIPELTL